MIDWIDFGQVSAERDENLSGYFFENGILQSVIENRHQFLILGRKGAGKTAVFQHFNENYEKYTQRGDLIESLSLQDYSWDIHGLLSAEGKATSLAYIQSWKYIIYLLAVKSLRENGEDTPKLRAAAQVIAKVYTSPAPSLGQVIGQKLLQLSRLKLPGVGLGLDGGDFDSLSADGGEVSFSDVQNDGTLQTTLNRSIERLSGMFEEALFEALSNDRRFIISFDRIDEAWDSYSFENSKRIISGLISAAEFINTRFRGRLRPIVFLREDIFETLDLNDKNKLRADCGQLLAWTKPSLSRMILERVNFFARKAGMPNFSRVEDLFDREQMRQQRTPFDHMMLRTMLRPRDFIRFFQLVKADMISRRDDPFDAEEVSSGSLECQSIYNVEPAYSEWLVEEIKDEWKTQYPVIIQLLAAIQNNEKTVFNLEQFTEAVAKVGIVCGPVEISGYLKFLFDNSLIGFRVGGSNQWRFKCFFATQGFIESDIYKVHDGLHRGLNLRESRSQSDP